MSRETSEWLNRNVLVGFTQMRGQAWHYKADSQGAEPNHYEGAIPVEDVQRRLFHWKAVEAPVYFHNESGHFKINDRKAIVRDDTNTTLGVFTDNYTIHQYQEWLLDNVANIIDDSNLQIGSAGLLKGGGVAWVSIEMPDNLTTKDGFEFRPHLLACTSHNGSLATTYKRVVTAVVCDNTLSLALGESGSQFKTRHSKHSNSKIQNVRDALGIVHAMADDAINEIERLSSIPVTDAEWDEIVSRLIPTGMEDTRPQAVSRAKNKQDAIQHMYRYDQRVAPWSGTGLGVLQAFNTYYHHVSGKDDSRVERNSLNAINGKTSDFDKQVMSVLEQVVLV